MEYRYLGNSGLRVSTVSLGTMNFSATTNEAAARKIMNEAWEGGVNFVDCADAYNGGKAEEMLGKLIRRDRDKWVLATKVGQQARSPGIQYLIAHSTRLMTNGLDEVGLSHADRSDKERPFLTLNELTGSQVHNLPRWCLRVEGKIEGL